MDAELWYIIEQFFTSVAEIQSYCMNITQEGNVLHFLTTPKSNTFACIQRVTHLVQMNSKLHGIENRRLTPEDVVNEIIMTLEDTFGKDLPPTMETCFDKLYQISFKDSSVFDYPDRFAEALLYAFGEGREPMLKVINERLAKLQLCENVEELAKSGAYGYVFLINLIKRKMES